MTKTEQLEHDILRLFKCACRQDRPDIAEFMLAALEKLDHRWEDTAANDRPLLEAYFDVVTTCRCRRK